MHLNRPLVATLTAITAFVALESQAQARIAEPVCAPDDSGYNCDGGGYYPPPPPPPPPAQPPPTINGLQPGGSLANQPGVCKLPGSSYDASRNLCIAGAVAQGYIYFTTEWGQTGNGYGNTAIWAEPCEAGGTVTTAFVPTGPEECYESGYDDYGHSQWYCNTPGYNEKTCHYNDGSSAPAACPIGTAVNGGNGEILGCQVVKAPTQGTSTYIRSQALLSNGDLAYTPNLGSPITTSSGQTRTGGTLATVYIHGRAEGPQRGWDYWDNYYPGAQPLWVAWNSRERLSQSTAEIDNFLDAVCRTTDTGVANTCQVVCHSAGCEMITYRLSQRPGRWNVLNVTAVEGAQGGTNMGTISAKLQAARPWLQWLPGGWILLRLADATFGLYPIDYDLQIPVARGMYDHNVSGNVPISLISSNFQLHVDLHCRWYNVICHIAQGVLSLLTSAVNGALGAIHGGSSDGALPLASTEGFSSSNNGWSSCQSRWYGYNTRLGGCGLGANKFHSGERGAR